MTIEARKLVKEAAEREVAIGPFSNEQRMAYYEGLRIGFAIGTADDPRHYVRPVSLEWAIKDRRCMGNPVPEELT
jgi:predicted transcriptional regulator